nr:UDP-glycosyltransferase 212A2 [Strigamia maritima]
MKKTLTLFLLTIQLLAINSEEILILQPFSPHSHKLVANPIAEALGARGHHVTHVSTFEFEGSVPANVTEIVYPQFRSSFAVLQGIVIDTIRHGWYPNILTRYFELHAGLCQQFYESGLLQKWMSKKKKFRVVIMDCVFTECLLPLWQYIGESVIILNTSPLTAMIVKIINLPTPYSIVPHSLRPYTHHMTFDQRFINTIYWLLSNYIVDLSQEMFYKRVILPNFPDIKPNNQLLTNISLVLVNEDPVFCYPRPYLPTVILIGGIHCKPARPLPQSDLKTFIDDSGDDGFILVSFGSIINGDLMNKEFVATLMTAFAQIKQRVIWKYESKLDGLPDNVMTVKWFPQKDILGHPKLRTFINQGGMNTVQESLYNAIPQICFPMTSDQPMLVAGATSLGIVISLDFRTVTADELVSAINKASTDQEMKKKVQYFSEVFRDRKEAPLDTAIYWIEHVMKYNGAAHLQSSIGDLNLIQYYLIDVYALCLLIFLLIVMVFWLSVTKIVNFFSRKMLNVNWKLKIKPE